LAGGHGERRVPEQIVKAGGDPPRPQRVKQHLGRIGRFVGVVLVEQRVTRMLRVKQPRQLLTQLLDLLLGQNPNARHIAKLLIMLHLRFAE
jgi:hypothetical protein